MKNKLWIILCAVALAACVIPLALNWHQPADETLPRNLDTEFRNGSGIVLDTATDLQRDSLYKLGKVWGFVKYRHPDILAGKINWDAELFRVMPGVLAAESPEAVNGVLLEWLTQFSFTVTTPESAVYWLDTQQQFPGTTLDLNWLSDREMLGDELCRYLEDLSHTYAESNSRGYATVSMEESGGKADLMAEKDMPLDPADAGVKLLALFRLWNAYEYYSPYVDITDGDWDDTLRTGIGTMLEARTTREYLLTLASVTAATGDAHVMFSGDSSDLYYYYGPHSLPCHCLMLDGRAVVDAVPEGQKDLQPGDVLLAVDGQTMEDRLAELRSYFPLPEENKYGYTMRGAHLSTASSRAEVTVDRGGQTLTFSVSTLPEAFYPENPWKNGLMEDGRVGYIDPSVLAEGQLEALMKDFAGTDGIIVDLRNYPSVPIVFTLGEYIIPEPVVFLHSYHPNPVQPGSFYGPFGMVCGAGSSEIMGSSPKESPPAYEGKVILLMNDLSQSQCETTIQGLRQAPRATVVGSPSIGADGDIITMPLPGGLYVVFTGLGFFTADDAPIQRVGLQPDVFCQPTAEDLRQGRDVLLEKAVELILE